VLDAGERGEKSDDASTGKPGRHSEKESVVKLFLLFKARVISRWLSLDTRIQ
jgi:hypothetical protein